MTTNLVASASEAAINRSTGELDTLIQKVGELARVVEESVSLSGMSMAGVVIALSVVSLLLVGLGAWMYVFFRNKHNDCVNYVRECTQFLAGVYQDGLSKSTADRIAPAVALKVEDSARKIIESSCLALRQDLERFGVEINAAKVEQHGVSESVKALQKTQDSNQRVIDSIGTTISVNADLEKENDSLKAEKASLEDELAAVRQNREEQKHALEETRSTVEQLKTDINEMTSAHESKITELETALGAKIAELNVERDKLLAEKDAQMQSREAELLDAYRDFTQPDIASMFGFSLADAGQGGSLKTVVYSYLAFLGRNMRENDFIRRFGVFDQELYHALRDDSDALERCRRNVERHIETWNREGCRLIVEWAQLGSVYNDDLDNAEGGSGTQVDGVLRARIFAVDELGNRVCKAKGLVVTA